MARPRRSSGARVPQLRGTGHREVSGKVGLRVPALVDPDVRRRTLPPAAVERTWPATDAARWSGDVARIDGVRYGEHTKVNPVQIGIDDVTSNSTRTAVVTGAARGI